jgi:hypothetical protein
MTAIRIRCSGDQASGWTCAVSLRDAEDEDAGEVSRHEVRVRPADLERLRPGATDPSGLVEASFAFLLEREPPRSILRSFDLLEIARYFPEYEGEMARVGRRPGGPYDRRDV